MLGLELRSSGLLDEYFYPLTFFAHLKVMLLFGLISEWQPDTFGINGHEASSHPRRREYLGCRQQTKYWLRECIKERIWVTGSSLRGKPAILRSVAVTYVEHILVWPPALVGSLVKIISPYPQFQIHESGLRLNASEQSGSPPPFTLSLSVFCVLLPLLPSFSPPLIVIFLSTILGWCQEQLNAS